MRKEYNTRQKREILSFLQARDLESYSVDDLLAEMLKTGEKIGRSTVYRNLEQLSEQGKVRKYQDAQGVIRYQYVENSSDCHDHFHMMCKSCGKLFHVNCDLMKQLSGHIFSHHHFRLDSCETILVGFCADCDSGETKGECCHGADCAEGCHSCV
ncbi:MAG: transcriptional repressor [Clostridia bacterium]|nr:transcriptional repressor [Clostridia bacterium]